MDNVTEKIGITIRTFIQHTGAVPTLGDFRKQTAVQGQELPHPDQLKKLFNINSDRGAVRTMLLAAGIDPVQVEDAVMIDIPNPNPVPSPNAPSNPVNLPAPSPPTVKASDRVPQDITEHPRAVKPLKPRKHGGFVYVSTEPKTPNSE